MTKKNDVKIEKNKEMVRTIGRALRSCTASVPSALPLPIELRLEILRRSELKREIASDVTGTAGAPRDEGT